MNMASKSRINKVNNRRKDHSRYKKKIDGKKADKSKNKSREYDW